MNNALRTFQQELEKIAAEDRKMDGMGAIERAMHQIDLVYPDAEKKPKQQPKTLRRQAATPQNRDQLLRRLLVGTMNR